MKDLYWLCLCGTCLYYTCVLSRNMGNVSDIPCEDCLTYKDNSRYHEFKKPIPWHKCITCKNLSEFINHSGNCYTCIKAYMNSDTLVYYKGGIL